MNIKPIHEYVLVERDESNKMSDGGIYIPEANREWAKTGIVKGTGSKVKEVKQGDKVQFIWSAGFDIKSDDVAYNTLLLMKESDILAVIEP